MKTALLAVLLAMACAAAHAAEPLDPCSLLSPGELSEIGVSSGVSAIAGNGGDATTLSCRYRAPGAPGAGAPQPATATVVVSVAGTDRVRQFRALFAKALAENTTAELQARGEHYSGSVMCKVVIAGTLETSQCLGTTDASAVAFVLSRTSASAIPPYPALQLRLMSELVERARQKGG